MIRVPKVRVIGHDGTQVGIMNTSEALKLAEEKNFDLVEVAPNAKPPVCKIMDYGKYKYQQNKRAKDAKKKQHIVHIKGIRLNLKTGKHDIETKVKQARKFIEGRDKVKFSLMLKGRERDHSEIAFAMMVNISEALEDIAHIEQKAKLEGRVITMIVAPAKSNKSKTKSEN